MANHTQGKSPCKEKWQQKEYNFEFLKEYFYFSANDMLGGKHSCEYSYIFRLAVKFMFFFCFAVHYTRNRSRNCH